jgi:cell wall-associated NlpC family hydrolase
MISAGKPLLWSIIFIFALICLSAASGNASRDGSGRERTAIVNVPRAEVFAKNSGKSERVTEMLLGDVFKVTREVGDWAFGYIPSQKGYKGWISKTSVFFPIADSPFEDKSLINVRTTSTRIFFRDGSFIDVFAGTRLPLRREKDGQYEVILPDGSMGFLSPDAGWIENENFGKEATPENVLSAARLFVCSYKWGGITVDGMDCSGFVYTVFRINGVYLKRDSYMQAEEGSSVSPNELTPGDLVFFHTRKGKRISHVGIYIGDGKFIHSSRSKKGISVSSLSEDFFRKSFAAARRVLPARDHGPAGESGGTACSSKAGKKNAS